jgi:hypothetical protein
MSAVREAPTVANQVRARYVGRAGPNEPRCPFFSLTRWPRTRSASGLSSCTRAVRICRASRGISTNGAKEEPAAVTLDAFGRSKMEGTGVVQPVGGGRFLELTKQGHQFAEWLIRKGRKCDFFWTPWVVGASLNQAAQRRSGSKRSKRRETQRPNQAMQRTAPRSDA